MRQEIREELNKNQASFESESVVDLRHLVISMIFMVIIFLLVLYIFYFLFQVESIDKLLSENYHKLNNTSIIDDKLNTNGNYNSNSLNLATLEKMRTKIKENSFFKDNQDYSTPIPLKPVGKSNPFVENAPYSGNTIIVKNDDQFNKSSDEKELKENNLPVIK